jgi:hypothetical protein
MNACLNEHLRELLLDERLSVRRLHRLLDEGFGLKLTCVRVWRLRAAVLRGAPEGARVIDLYRRADGVWRMTASEGTDGQA